jgi:hypothetical protein
MINTIKREGRLPVVCYKVWRPTIALQTCKKIAEVIISNGGTMNNTQTLTQISKAVRGKKEIVVF